MSLESSHTLYVTTPGERPHFWLLEGFVWEEEKSTADFDTEGDADQFDSTIWTELTIINRDDKEERFDVSQIEADPLTLIVISDKQYLVARAAYALAVYTGGEVSEFLGGPFNPPDVLIPQMGATFDLSAALNRNEWLIKPSQNR